MKLEKATVVLQHLLRGGRTFKIKFKGDESPRTLVLSHDYELCELRKRENGEEVLLPVLGVDMGPFVKLCEKLTNEEVFSIGAATAMADMMTERKTGRRHPTTVGGQSE